jgi:hypothetical protein
MIFEPEKTILSNGLKIYHQLIPDFETFSFGFIIKKFDLFEYNNIPALFEIFLNLCRYSRYENKKISKLLYETGSDISFVYTDFSFCIHIKSEKAQSELITRIILSLFIENIDISYDDYQLLIKKLITQQISLISKELDNPNNLHWMKETNLSFFNLIKKKIFVPANTRFIIHGAYPNNLLKVIADALSPMTNPGNYMRVNPTLVFDTIAGEIMEIFSRNKMSNPLITSNNSLNALDRIKSFPEYEPDTVKLIFTFVYNIKPYRYTFEVICELLKLYIYETLREEKQYIYDAHVMIKFNSYIRIELETHISNLNSLTEDLVKLLIKIKTDGFDKKYFNKAIFNVQQSIINRFYFENMNLFFVNNYDFLIDDSFDFDYKKEIKQLKRVEYYGCLEVFRKVFTFDNLFIDMWGLRKESVDFMKHDYFAKL